MNRTIRRRIATTALFAATLGIGLPQLPGLNPGGCGVACQHGQLSMHLPVLDPGGCGGTCQRRVPANEQASAPLPIHLPSLSCHSGLCGGRQ
jgi:hypothetical protein